MDMPDLRPMRPSRGRIAQIAVAAFILLTFAFAMLVNIADTMRDKDASMSDDLHEALKDPMLIFALSCIPIVLAAAVCLPVLT